MTKNSTPKTPSAASTATTTDTSPVKAPHVAKKLDPFRSPKERLADRQVQTNPKSYAGETVTVASKLPMAIQLQICESRIVERHDRSTTWNETVFYKTGPIYTLRGTAFPNADIPEGWERPDMASGAALTYGIPLDFWEKWVAQNEATDMVSNGLIFAATNTASAKDMAKDVVGIDSMLGPVHRGKDSEGNDTINDPRMPKKIKTAVGSVTVGAQKAA